MGEGEQSQGQERSVREMVRRDRMTPLARSQGERPRLVRGGFKENAVEFGHQTAQFSVQRLESLWIGIAQLIEDTGETGSIRSELHVRLERDAGIKLDRLKTVDSDLAEFMLQPVAGKDVAQIPSCGIKPLDSWMLPQHQGRLDGKSSRSSPFEKNLYLGIFREPDIGARRASVSRDVRINNVLESLESRTFPTAVGAYEKRERPQREDRILQYLEVVKLNGFKHRKAP